MCWKIRLVRQAAGICLLLCWLGAALAQEVGPGSVSFESRWEATRSHAPLFLEGNLNWPSSDLLEGRLEVESYRDQRLLSRWISADTIVTDAGQKLSLLLPPPIINDEQREPYRLVARFHGSEQSIYLDEHLPATDARWRRTMVVGLIEDRNTAIPAGLVATEGSLEDFFKSLRFDERLNARTAEEATLLRTWQQRVIAVPPAELPANPLQLLAFDILMVSTDQLVKLSPGQLEALRLWTAGGGSLAVSLAGNVPNRLEAWLNEIAGGTALAPVLTISANGRVNLLNAQHERVRRAFPGVGRSILVLAPPQVDSVEWQGGVLHLWKVRTAQAKRLLAQQPLQFTEANDWTRLDPYEPLPWDPTYDSTASTMTSLLLPSEVSGVPLWLVCSILGACLLIAVPGDYFILGGLKLRRWTWLLMPLVAIGFTWYMITTANGYMGNQDHTQKLTFVDLSQSLEPVRWTQFELAFPATTKSIKRRQQQVLEIDLGEGRSVTQSSFPQNTSNQLNPDILTREEFQLAANQLTQTVGTADVSPTDIPIYSGSVPGDYDLERRLNQWTPRVARLTSFQPLPGIDATWAQSSGMASEWLPETLLAGNQSQLVKHIWKTLPNATVLYWEQDAGWIGAAPSSSPRREAIVRYVVQQTNRKERGLFRVVSQVSPMGTTLTEDLALDTEQRVLVIITTNPDESEFVAWRLVLPKPESSL